MAVQETRTLPAPFINQLGTDLASQITAQAQVPVVAPGAGGITQLAGESSEDFAKKITDLPIWISGIGQKTNSASFMKNQLIQLFYYYVIHKLHLPKLEHFFHPQK